MIFLKRWFGYAKTTFGGMHEYQDPQPKTVPAKKLDFPIQEQEI